MVEDELNVDVVEVTGELGDVLAYELVPNFKLLGPTARGQGPAAAGGHGLGRRRRGGGRAWPPAGRWWSSSTTAPSSSLGDEVELRVRAQAGFAVSRDGAEVVALDLALDDDLRRRGLAREVIRNVQEMRKATGLEVSDWIHLHLVGSRRPGAAVRDRSPARCWPDR